MGTSATFNVFTKKDKSSIFNKCIGMTCDGFPSNLSYLANQFLKAAEEHSYGDSFEDPHFVYKIMKKTITPKYVDDWYRYMFIEPRNAPKKFLSYNGFLNPFTGILEVGDSKGYLVKRYQCEKADLMHNIDPKHEHHSPFLEKKFTDNASLIFEDIDF